MESVYSFFNRALAVDSALPPAALLSALLDIEKEMGRKRDAHQGAYADRTVDIDILMIEQLILRVPGLEIPHPRMHLRKFTLLPLAEIAPDLHHPVLSKPIKTLLKECTDTSDVERYAV